MLDDDILSKLPILNKVHQKILSLNKNIEFRVFPIYIRYIKNDTIYAILYFKKKELLELGLNVDNKPSNEFVEAKGLGYKEIKYKVLINEETNLNKIFSFLKR